MNFERIWKHEMLTNAERRAIAAAAREKTVNQLVAYFRVSSSTVYAVLREFGIKPLTVKGLLKR